MSRLFLDELKLKDIPEVVQRSLEKYQCKNIEEYFDFPSRLPVALLPKEFLEDISRNIKLFYVTSKRIEHYKEMIEELEEMKHLSLPRYFKFKVYSASKEKDTKPYFYDEHYVSVESIDDINMLQEILRNSIKRMEDARGKTIIVDSLPQAMLYE